MIEIKRTKCRDGGLVFHMTGTKREHLELSEKIKFPYKNYECYVSDVPDINVNNLDKVEGFKIIAIRKINNE